MVIPIHLPNLEKKIKKDEQADMAIPIHPPNFVGGVTIKLYLLANCYQRAAINGTGIITSVFKDILICLHRLKIPHPYLPHRNTHIPKPLTEIFQPGVENIWSPLPPIPVPKADKTADSLTEVETPVAIKKSTSFSVKEAIPVACRILPAVFKWMDNLSVRLMKSLLCCCKRNPVTRLRTLILSKKTVKVHPWLLLLEWWHYHLWKTTPIRRIFHYFFLKTNNNKKYWDTKPISGGSVWQGKASSGSSTSSYFHRSLWQTKIKTVCHCAFLFITPFHTKALSPRLLKKKK